MVRKLIFGLVVLFLACPMVELTGCRSAKESTGFSQLESAAGTATALIQNAQATAVVLKAQAMATSLVESANVGISTITPTGINSSFVEKNTPGARVTPSSQPTSAGVQVVDVTTAADGVYIMVEFKAPARLSETWRQGNVYVIDEATGNIYNEIPSVGTIGLLIGRPKEDGKLGYVMLVNAPFPLKAGSLVTVVLGDFKQEHVMIQ